MRSILCGVGDIIDQELQLTRIGRKPQYQHKAHCRKLTKSPDKFDAKVLIERIYETVGRNWNGAREPSPKNWRLTKNCAKEDEGKNENRKKKLEVRLEREIVGINWPDGEDWFNQVPVASGLINDRSDKRRAIDLVHQCGDGSYEFIELKVDSDTPLYAAMEILQYAILYMFARRNERIRGAASEKRLLEATAIHLRVLAPCHYYNGYQQLDRLEDEICKGINRFLEREKITLQMDFAFEAFPADFKLHKLGHFPNADAIVQALRRVEALK